MKNIRCLKSVVTCCALLGTTGAVIRLDCTRVAFAKPAAAASASGASSASDDSSSSSASGGASVEANRPAEKKAAKLAGEATGADFKAGRQPIAEKKLRDAIQICMMQTCSEPFKARLHRDLGFIYVVGLKRVEDGKDEFTAALTADPTVILTTTMAGFKDARQAFEDVKSGMASSQASTAASEKEPAKAEADAVDDADAKASGDKVAPKKSTPADDDTEAATAAPLPEPAPPKAYLNWLSLAIEQDLVYHSTTPNACSGGDAYKCYDGHGAPWPPITNAVPGGNRVNGGLASGPWRILAGYDRVFARRITLGARVGAMVAGKAATVKGDRAVMLFHGEARAAVWLGRDPFAVAGLRPYVFLSGGVAEADGMVLVEYSPQGCANCGLSKVKAWKRSGPEFVGAGAGAQFAITPRMGPTLEARYMQFLSPSVPVIGVQLGYAIGL